MDAELRALIREIAAHAPEIANWLDQLWRGGLGPSRQIALAGTIAELARLYPGIMLEIMRALAMIMRINAIPAAALTPGGTVVTGGAVVAADAAAGGAAAGTAAAGGAATATSGGAAAVAGGTVTTTTTTTTAAGAGMTAGAALFLLFAIGVLTYRVYRELTQELDIGDAGGTPCTANKLGELMATLPREVTVDAWSGRKDSFQKAIDEAWTEALRMRSNCAGSCAGPRKCMPIVAIRDWDQWSTFPYNTTYTNLIYTLPCFCVLPVEYWAQFKWHVFPEDVAKLWRRTGIDEDGWDERGSMPRPWSDLDADGREAAGELGFDADSWPY